MQINRLEKLLEMLKEDPLDSFLKYAIATEYVKLNDHENALFYYTDLITNHEDYVGTYYHLGKLYESMDNKHNAEEIYKKGLMIARKIGDTHSYSELQTVYNSLMGLDYEDD